MKSAEGWVLVEWLTGLSAGLMLISASLTFYARPLIALRDLAQRQRVSQDLDALEEVMRREWRRAGLRCQRGANPEYDAVTWVSGGSTVQSNWHSDAGTLASTAGPPSNCGNAGSTLRFQQQGLQLRTPSTGGFQALHDVKSSAVRIWSGHGEITAQCEEVIRWRLAALAPGHAERVGVVRRRNGGLLACEATP